MGDCICDSGWPVDSNVEIVVLRHALERFKASGSAKLIPLVLRKSTIIDVGVQGTTAPTNVCRGTTVLLFPGGRPIVEIDRIDRLVVLDGTWSQARRMRYRLAALEGIPTVSISAPPPALALREPRHEGELATAVAVAHALCALGQTEGSRELHRAFEALVAALKPARESRRG